jgi:sugar phosphate isomerase/epimerase
MQVAYVEQCARLAQAWGARIVRVFTSYEHGTQDLKGVWAMTVAALRECADRIAPLGVSLAVQNHHDVGVATEALAELLAEIDRPNCKAGFDAWSPALQGLDGEGLYKVARKMAPMTIQTICADYVRFPRYNYLPSFTNYVRAEPDLVMAVPFGEGFIDYVSFFRGLRDGGFDGWVVYEMCERLRGGGGVDNLDRCARKFLDFLKKIQS